MIAARAAVSICCNPSLALPWSRGRRLPFLAPQNRLKKLAGLGGVLPQRRRCKLSNTRRFRRWPRAARKTTPCVKWRAAQYHRGDLPVRRIISPSARWWRSLPDRADNGTSYSVTGRRNSPLAEAFRASSTARPPSNPLAAFLLKRGHCRESWSRCV